MLANQKPMSTALLLIDIQQSLCTGPNAAWDCPT